MKANVFIVGASKSGTTSLHEYLNEHPEIFMSPIKETNFFATDLREIWGDNAMEVLLNEKDLKHYFQGGLKKIKSVIIQSAEFYERLFKLGEDYPIRGESSVSYLLSKEAAKNIYNYNPSSKIIAILRNPYKRAFSQYVMELGLGTIPPNISFIDAVKKFKREQYIEIGTYSSQIKRYLDLFPNDNILVIKFKSLKSNLQKTMKKIYLFLGVEPSFQINPKIYNTGKLAKLNLITYLISKVKWLEKLRYHLGYYLPEEIKRFLISLFYKDSNLKISERESEFLKPYFNQDINILNNLLKIDFSDWKF